MRRRFLKSFFAVLAAASLSPALLHSAATQYFYPNDLPTAAVDAPIVYGEWHLGWKECKAYADANDAPMIAVWGNHGCIHCFALESVFTNSVFKAWQKTNDTGKVVCCFMAGGLNGYPDQQWSDGYNYLRNGKSRDWPMVLFYWPKNGIKKFYYGDQVRDGNSYYKIDQSVQPVINKFTTLFAGWKPTGDYKGGKFAFEETESNRLEADDKTESVSFDLVRDEDAATVATNNVVDVVGVDGMTILMSTNVEWAVGQTRQTIEIPLAKDGNSAFADAHDGDSLAIVLSSASAMAQCRRQQIILCSSVAIRV